MVMSGSRTRKHVYVSGRVQGVFFRDSTRRSAQALSVDGWVRNLSDGRVEAVFEGPSAQVSKMVEWIGHGPPHADVRDVEVLDEAPEDLHGFRVR
jgi:acylphosphatase